MDAFPYFSGDAITHFLSQGGAVLTTGGVPFGMPVDEDGNSPGFTDAAGNTMPAAPRRGLLDDTTYGDWVAPLGYKYYEHPYAPTVNHADRRFFPSLPAEPELAGCRIGIVANTSRHSPVPKPSHGNVFPERYPARQVLPLLWGTDKYGQVLAVNTLLIQDFEDGSRRIHFAHEAEPHPMSPTAPHFYALMDDIFNLLTNRCIVKDVETNYACYRQGEIVQVRAELASFEPKVSEAEVILEILAGGQVVYTQSEITRFAAQQSVIKEWPWSPRRFDTDEYEVVVNVRRGGRVVSSAANGFLVWNNKAVTNGPSVDIRGKYFRIGESESFVSGTNYYESTRGEIMWYRPNVKRIAQDLRQMREHGVNYIRPHYHHLKWFKDYLLFQHGKLPEFYKNLGEVTNPLPDERAWRIWDAFIYLCQKLGMVYGGDLFTLVPDEMGDPRGWFPLRESVYCPEKRELKEPGDQQGYSLHHVSGARCFAAMSLASASWAGKPLVSGPAGGYVYMFTENGEDLFTARQTFAKTEKPGKLIFHFRSTQPRAVNLVDTSPLGNKRLETLPWSSRPDGIEVTVAPTQQAYWVAVEW